LPEQLFQKTSSFRQLPRNFTPQVYSQEAWQSKAMHKKKYKSLSSIIVVKMFNKFKCPPAGKRINKMLYIHTMRYYSLNSGNTESTHNTADHL